MLANVCVCGGGCRDIISNLFNLSIVINKKLQAASISIPRFNDEFWREFEHLFFVEFRYNSLKIAPGGRGEISAYSAENQIWKIC